MKDIMLDTCNPNMLRDERVGEISEWPECLFYIGQDCTDDEVLATMTIQNVLEALQILQHLESRGKLNEFLDSILNEKAEL